MAVVKLKHHGVCFMQVQYAINYCSSVDLSPNTMIHFSSIYLILLNTCYDCNVIESYMIT